MEQQDLIDIFSVFFFKPRVLRKHIKACLKKYEGLAEDECVRRFCFILKDVWNWEQEIFTCHLGVRIHFFHTSHEHTNNLG